MYLVWRVITCFELFAVSVLIYDHHLVNGSKISTCNCSTVNAGLPVCIRDTGYGEMEVIDGATVEG